MRSFPAFVVLAAALHSSTVLGQTGNIDPAQRHAWAENAGWLDFRPAFGGVMVLPTHLTGFAWQESVGWVKLGADAGGPYGNTSSADWGVNLNTVTGALSGWAWSESVGWIRMDPEFGGVTYLGLTHELSGWAWSEGVGWIHFRSTSPTAYGVAITCSTVTGTVTGGETICANSFSTVTVTVSGGTAPYSITLDNGGGTRSGTGPAFDFSVNPGSTTTYTVASLVDALSCTGTGSGSATVTIKATPASPTITAPTSLWPEQSFTASVPAVDGVSYSWTVTNGTVTDGAGTHQISVTAGSAGSVVVSIVLTDTATGCSSAEASVSIPVDLSATLFYPVTPCRLFDTRRSEPDPDAASPSLAPGQTRILSIGTRCGLSVATVRSLSVNVTVAGQTADGELAMYRGDLADEPVTSVISFKSEQTRANNGFLELSWDADGTFKVRNRSASPVDFILDVNGVFR